MASRLELLRAGDYYRTWQSVDDRRVCNVCRRFITGRQIEIQRDQRGRFLLHCPTEDCESTVKDWEYTIRPASRVVCDDVKLEPRGQHSVALQVPLS